MKRGAKKKKKKAAPKKKAAVKGGKRGKTRAKLVQKTEQQLFILNSVRQPRSLLALESSLRLVFAAGAGAHGCKHACAVCVCLCCVCKGGALYVRAFACVRVRLCSRVCVRVCVHV